MSRLFSLQHMCIYNVICVIVVKYLSNYHKKVKNTLSANFKKSEQNTYTWNFDMSSGVIQHQKGKKLIFMIGFVRLHEMTPV